MLGKYKKKKLLSDLPTGAVWLVVDESSNKEYAAKLINPKHENKVAEQIPMLKALKNSRLAQYIDAFEDKEGYVLIMEYCSSISLK